MVSRSSPGNRIVRQSLVFHSSDWLVPPGWQSLRPNGVVQAQFARCPLDPVIRAGRAAPHDAQPNSPEFLRAQRGIHPIGPIHRPVHRPWRSDGLDRLISVHPCPQAARAPVLGPLDQTGPQRVALDIPQHGQQLVVALHREALESALIEMPVPHRSVCDPPPHRMGLCEPTKESRHLIVLLRPDGEVPMIRIGSAKPF